MWNRSPILKNLTTLLLFIFLEALSIYLVKENSLYQRIRLNSLSISAIENLTQLSSNIKNYFSLKEVNKVLAEENTELRNRLEKFLHNSRDSSEHNILEYNNTLKSHFSYKRARVLSNSTNRLNNHLILDKGSDSGVEVGMGVISSYGVVGVIEDVTSNFSVVTSLLNVNQSFSAKLLSSGAFGTLKWDGRDRTRAILKEIPHHIEVKIGDTVSTSGYSLIFPQNIPIGVVEKFHLESGAHFNIEVRLLQDFYTIRFVDIIMNHNREEIESLR